MCGLNLFVFVPMVYLVAFESMKMLALNDGSNMNICLNWADTMWNSNMRTKFFIYFGIFALIDSTLTFGLLYLFVKKLKKIMNIHTTINDFNNEINHLMLKEFEVVVTKSTILAYLVVFFLSLFFFGCVTLELLWLSRLGFPPHSMCVSLVCEFAMLINLELLVSLYFFSFFFFFSLCLTATAAFFLQRTRAQKNTKHKKNTK